ncbi:hypothetical protein [Vogesella indigofera]|uniref:hypothetical protein n=1 Tax=Vogesella indigofera TaxID=45465 RepID=UPI00234F4355|nr:hypothetical protein [Vogesella indigofera]MDC7701608.1 hypothetical protein [Vogesella indigofera]
MSSCYDDSFLCQNPQYPDFDNIAIKELRNPPSVHEIINQSNFCTHLPTNADDIIGDITHKMYLKGLNNKTGLYHLWIEFENCTDHNAHTMLCIYVGKGMAENRINIHIKEKLLNNNVSIYASFYECSNRISKYLEQLFLDTYSFILNKNENSGDKKLFAVWGEERYILGTEINAVSSLCRIQNFDDL